MWSYASVLTAGDSFSGVKPVRWGAKGLVVPSTRTPNPGPIASVTLDVRAFTAVGGNCSLFNDLGSAGSWYFILTSISESTRNTLGRQDYSMISTPQVHTNAQQAEILEDLGYRP
jgi:hypothetical protein